MIKEVSIQNFQSHKDTHLEFHPGVNIIVGTSDSGKSAIIRTIRWVLQNKPLGDSFRSMWGGETKVTLTLPEGQITRSKDKSDKYTIEGPPKLELEAFRTSVPEEVLNMLNINSVNLQFQHDPPFLISSTSGEVAS